MTKVDIKEEDVVPYGIVKTIDLPVNKQINTSLIATVLIIKSNIDLLKTLNSVKGFKMNQSGFNGCNVKQYQKYECL